MKNLIIFCLIFSADYSFSQDFSQEIAQTEHLKMVVCYAYNQGDNYANRINTTPLINLNSNGSIILEFDDLNASYAQYRARIIHCDADWQKSNLIELEYLDGYNEYIINNYEVSEGTKTMYYHYAFRVPKLKVAGNYILQVFEDVLDGNLVIQKKIRICDPKLGILANVQVAQDPAIWRTNQQINVEFDASNYFISFPKKELRVMLRQNQRDSKMMELNTSNLNLSGSNKLKFNYFNNENTYKGGNEFRFCDISATFAGGVNVKKTIKGDPNEIEIYPQTSRLKKGYLNSYDNNGNYIINTIQNNNPDLTADYVKVKFSLDAKELPTDAKPIIHGKFTNWNAEEMTFNDESQMFEKTFLLKNGYYDFSFAKKTDKVIDDSYFEGDFSETENVYEVFVYQKAPGFRSDQLIGYAIFSYNASKK